MKYFFKYRNKSKVLAIILLVATLCSLPACVSSGNTATSVDIVKAITASEIGLPAGKLYSSSAREGESGYISESLLNSLFGNGSRPALLDGWIDYAFFMPTSSHPCEFVAILCDTPTTATDTARLLCARLNTIKRVKTDSQYAHYLDNAEVTICRNYVLLIISSDTEAAKKTAISMVK